MASIAYEYPNGFGGISGGGMTGAPDGMTIPQALEHIFRETATGLGGPPSQITGIRLNGALNEPYTPVSRSMSDRARRAALGPAQPAGGAAPRAASNPTSSGTGNS